MSEYHREYYLKNKERLRAYAKARYHKKKAERERVRELLEVLDPDELAEKDRKWLEQEEIRRERQKRYMERYRQLHEGALELERIKRKLKRYEDKVAAIQKEKEEHEKWMAERKAAKAAAQKSAENSQPTIHCSTDQ